MSDKRDNLDKIGTYSTISLPFELNAEQLSKLPPGKELHFDRAKQTVRGADYCYAVSRACYRTERSRSVTIASKTLGKIFADDPEQNVYRNRPRNWKQLAQIQAAEAAVKEAKTHQEPTGTGVYSVQGILGMLESAIEFRDDGTSFPTIVKVPASVCFKLPKWNGFSLKSERRLLAPPSGFIPRKVLASKLGGGLNQRSP